MPTVYPISELRTRVTLQSLRRDAHPLDAAAGLALRREQSEALCDGSLSPSEAMEALTLLAAFEGLGGLLETGDA